MKEIDLSEAFNNINKNFILKPNPMANKKSTAKKPSAPTVASIEKAVATRKPAAPADAKPKRSTPKPSPEVAAAIEAKREAKDIEIKEGDTVKVYNDHSSPKVALDGVVLMVHTDSSIDVLLIIPGRENESRGSVPHGSNVTDENALFWD